MQNQRIRCAPQVAATPAFRIFAPTLTLALTLLMGCAVTLSPLARRTEAFSDATATVIDNSKDAYRAAIDLRHREQVSAAIYAYDKKPGWSPYTDLQPLLTPEQLDARIKVLDGLKAYAESLTDLTSTKKQNEKLGTAAAGAGAGLQSLTAAAAPALKTTFPSMAAMSDDAAHGVSTAIVALADLLINQQVRKALPKITQDMTPNITVLCSLIDSDVNILRRQADVDYQSLVTTQDEFIQHSHLEPIQRRAEIANLIDIADEQKANDILLTKLKAAINTLATTHEALAKAVQGNDPQSLKQSIADLEAAGQDLGNYYQSLAQPANPCAKCAKSAK
jgi:hypothetical protein